MRKWNFCAGPAVISEEVLSEVQSELLEYPNSGSSIMEMSHRSSTYMKVALDAKQDLKDILKIPENYEILFLQGGATHQFSMIPMNFKNLTGSADYITTGSWTKKAFIEGSKIMDIKEIYSSEKASFTCAPDLENLELSENAAYVHYCPNETIEGNAIHEVPKINKPLVADMSSVILSEPIEIGNFSLIYAGAQKNIGPAGLTLVIVRDDLLDFSDKKTPTTFSWKIQSDNKSMINTPSTFSIYIAGLVFKWLKKNGGLVEIEKINRHKSDLLYNFIDASDFYYNDIEVLNRSRMNVPFRIRDESLTMVFVEEAEKSGLYQLKGHRLVGGLRASIYNAMPVEGIHALINFMQDFEKKYL